MLYDEAKLALAKISQVSASKSPVVHDVRMRSGDALEHMLDLLDLDAQPVVAALDLGDAILDVTTSTPLVMLLCEFAASLAEDEPSPIEQQVLLQRCTFLASLPDRLTNALCDESVTLKGVEIDLELLTTRICQALCGFLLAMHTTASCDVVDEAPGGQGGKRRVRYRCTGRQMIRVSETMMQSLVRRGYIRTLFHCFIDSVRGALSCASALSQEVIPLAFKVIYECSVRHKGVSSGGSAKPDSVRRGTHLYWSDWNLWFLRLAERDFQIKKVLVSSLLWMLNLPGTNSEVSEEMLRACQSLEEELFVTETTCLPTERGVLRLLFREILPARRRLPHAAEKEGGEEVGVLSGAEMRVFTEVLQKWGSRDFAEKGPVDVNGTVANAVLYILLYIKERFVDSENARLPGVLLKPLLDGVSVRFEIIRVGGMRNDAVTVASAFASFFVGSEEATRAFSSMDQFPALLNDWLRSERQSVVVAAAAAAPATQAPGLVQIPDHESHHRARHDEDAVVDAGSVSEFALCRRSLEDEEYPLNPDDTFLFFCRGGSALSKKTHSSRAETLCVHRDRGVANHDHLFSFGKTTHEKDELEDNATILVTMRESYNAVVGVGRSSNAQLYQVQQETENGLRGFALVLQRLKERLGAWREDVVNGDLLRSRERIGRELNPMISSLLPTLMSLNIHAPEARYNELMGLRHSIVVSLISITPEMALSQLGKMIYSSHYGVSQRVAMVRAIREAAVYLSQIEVHTPSQHHEASGLGEAKRDPGAPKRIYPPIQSASATPVAIVVTEGKETRRWGSAVAERADKKTKLYTNCLADVVTFFLSVFLARADDDHFAFFRDSDPYAPAEILQSISTVVQRIVSARHVAPTSCEYVFPFALVVAAQHPISSVRRQGWILIGEVMRCWCGAGPLVLSDSDKSVLPRGVFGGTLSYAFSEKWLNARQALEDTFRRRMNDPSCADVALLVLADVQDLLLAKRAAETMAERTLHVKGISVTAVTNDDVVATRAI